MTEVKPISPEDIQKGNFEIKFPPAVIEAFNELIVKDYSPTTRRAVVYQDAAMELVLSKLNANDIHGQIPTYSRSDVFNNKWLDVENVYRAQGWSVYYDKPAYNESYSAYFEFTKK